MSHVDYYAIAKYSGFSYQDKCLFFEKVTQRGEVEYLRFEEIQLDIEKPSLFEKILSATFNALFKLHPRIAILVVTTITCMNIFEDRCRLIDIKFNLDKHAFLYENLTQFDQYRVRALNKREVVATFDCANIYDHSCSSAEFCFSIEKYVDAMRCFFDTCKLPKVEEITLKILVDSAQNPICTRLGKFPKFTTLQGRQYTMHIKMILFNRSEQLMQELNKSDIHVLNSSPTQSSLAMAILNPAKIVLVTGNPRIILRHWSVVQDRHT